MISNRKHHSVAYVMIVEDKSEKWIIHLSDWNQCMVLKFGEPQVLSKKNCLDWIYHLKEFHAHCDMC